jgi:hypothetical protein
MTRNSCSLAVSRWLGSVWFAIRHMRTKLRWKHSRPASGAITPLTRDADLELLLQATCYLFPSDGSSRYK